MSKRLESGEATCGVEAELLLELAVAGAEVGVVFAGAVELDFEGLDLADELVDARVAGDELFW